MYMDISSTYNYVIHETTQKLVFHIRQQADELILKHSMHVHCKPKQHGMHLPFCMSQWVQSQVALTATVLPLSWLFGGSCRHT